MKTTDRILRWCDTHDQPAWDYDDGSVQCMYDLIVESCNEHVLGPVLLADPAPVGRDDVGRARRPRLVLRPEGPGPVTFVVRTPLGPKHRFPSPEAFALWYSSHKKQCGVYVVLDTEKSAIHAFDTDRPAVAVGSAPPAPSTRGADPTGTDGQTPA